MENHSIEELFDEVFGGAVLGEDDSYMPTLEMEPLMRGALDALVEERFGEYIQQKAEEIDGAKPEMLADIIQGGIEDFGKHVAMAIALEEWAKARHPETLEQDEDEPDEEG